MLVTLIDVDQKCYKKTKILRNIDKFFWGRKDNFAEKSFDKTTDILKRIQ